MADRAREKLREKNLDLIAANQVGEDRGFGDTDSALELFWRDGAEALPLAPKPRLARQLVRLVAQHYRRKRAEHAH